MDPDASTIVALKSRDQALEYMQSSNFGRSFSHFLVALKLKPDWKNQLKKEFSSSLCTWGEQLESQRRFKDLFNCYEQAIEIFPDNESVLCNLGSHLFRLGHLREAAHYFRLALDTNKDYLPAYRNLQCVSNALVEVWHFRMLNDSLRNEAYREAILKKVRQGFSSVLDIGTGTGILSMYAVSAGATEIHACDYSSTMCSIACEVLEANKMTGHVSVINKLSNHLTIPEDLPGRKSLVVTETMDAGLLGEHILQTLIHAWDHLLKPPCPELQKMLDSEISLAEHGVVVPFGAKLWAAPIQSHNVARRNYVIETSKSFWNLDNISLYSNSKEPYDSENLKQSSCKFLANPVEVFSFDFNNPKQLKEYYEGKHDGKIVRFKYEGKADALAVWFDVRLDEDITITSSPFSEEHCCWDQAVFRFTEPQESVLVKVSCSGGKLRFDLSQESINQWQTHTSPSTSNKLSKSQFPVRTETVLFLNNKQLCDSVSLLPELKDKMVNVLDLSPFPIFGLRMIQQEQSNLFCVLKTIQEIEAVIEFVKNNNVDPSKVKCLKVNELDELFSNTKYKFDFILNNLFDTSGELKEYNIAIIPKLMSVLSPDGILVPTCLQIMCRLADCAWITRVTKVVNEELVQTYNIAPFINIYQVSQQLDVDLQSIDCDYLSDSVACLQILQGDLASESIITEDIVISVVKDGVINAIPAWYHYQLLPDQKFWSTMDSDSHVNQVVYVVEPPCHVKSGDTVVINVTMCSGIVRLNLSR